MQADHSSICTLQLWSFWLRISMRFTLLKYMQGLPWKDAVLEHNVAIKPVYTTQHLIVSLQMFKLPFLLALTHPHSIRYAGFWTVSNKPNSPSPLYFGGQSVHDFFKLISNVFSDHRAVFFFALALKVKWAQFLSFFKSWNVSRSTSDFYVLLLAKY